MFLGKLEPFAASAASRGGNGWCLGEVGLVEVQKHLLPEQNRVEGVLLALTQPLVEFEEFRRQHFLEKRA